MATNDHPLPPEEMNWYYLDEAGQVAGPISDSSLRELACGGALKDESKVCREGTDDWIRLEDALGSTPAGTPPSPSTIKFSCPHCDQHIAADSSDAGLSTQCPACGGAVQVPETTRASLPLPDSPSGTPATGGTKVRSKKLIIFAGAGALIIMVGALAVLARQGSDDVSDALQATEQPSQIPGKESIRDDDPNNPTIASRHAVTGWQYYKGDQGLPRDFQQAAQLFRKAALQGNTMAQTYLGLMYFNGEGVEADYDEAFRWWTYAAELGCWEAQQKLGALHVARAHLKDYSSNDEKVSAYVWLNLAAVGDDQGTAQASSALRDQLAREMSKAEIAQAQRRSRQWKRKTIPELGFPLEE